MSEPLITTSESLNYESRSACPKHVAIIMDGNQRWAKSRHLPKALGHRAGAKNLKNIAKACANNGVEILTLFAFSTENWKRPREEVDLLIELMKGVLINDIKELCENKVRLSIIGDRSRFSPDIQLLMKNAEYLTKDCAHLTLNIAVNFGGRWEVGYRLNRLMRIRLVPICQWVKCLILIFVSERGAIIVLATFCYGTWLIPNCILPMNIGLSSPREDSWKLSKSTI